MLLCLLTGWHQTHERKTNQYVQKCIPWLTTKSRTPALLWVTTGFSFSLILFVASSHTVYTHTLTGSEKRAHRFSSSQSIQQARYILLLFLSVAAKNTGKHLKAQSTAWKYSFLSCTEGKAVLIRSALFVFLQLHFQFLFPLYLF